MFEDKSKNEFSKSPQPFRIKWSTRIDIYGGGRKEGEAWGKGETEAGKKEFGKGEEERCTASEPAIYDPATSSRSLPRRRRSQVEGFVKSGTRRSSLCLESRSRFHLKTLELDPSGAHGRARTRHSTHVKRLREKRESLFTRNLPVNFILYIEFLEQNSRGEIPRIDPPPLVGPSTFIYFLFYFPFILRFWKGNDLSRSFDILAFLTISILKQTNERIDIGFKSFIFHFGKKERY